MTPLLSAFTSALLHFAWQGLLVFVLLWITLSALRTRSANARYAACCIALAVLVAAPLITTWVLYRQSAPRFPITVLVDSSAPPAFSSPTTLPARQISGIAAVQPWVFPAWALGVLIFSLRMVYGCAQIAALRRRGQPAGPEVLSMVANLSHRLRVSRPTHVLISAWAGGPSLVGWLRPVILIPAAAVAGLTPQQLEAVLAHELAHIRRHDYLVNWIQLLVETLLFYHPAVWWISSRIRHERELCCDDLAVTACEGPMCYARALTTLEKMRAVTPALAVGSTGGDLLYRIRRIMGVTTEQYGPSRASGIVALSLAVACLVIGANWAHGQSQPSQDYLAQGDLLLRAGSTEQALQLYRQGAEKDATRLNVYLKRAIEALMRLNRKPEAAEVNARILRDHPEDTDALAFDATLRLDKGEVPDAITQLRQVIERVPDNPVAHFNLGQAYAAQHDDTAARREMEEAIRLRSDFTRAREALAKLNAVAAQPQRAREDALAQLQSESEKAPGRLDLQVALGDFAARAGKYDEAIYTFQRVLDRMDQNSNQRGDIYLRLGEAYRRKGDAAGAVQALQKARELLPDSRLALIALIMSLESAGRSAEAQQLRSEANGIQQNQAALTTNFLKDELEFARKKLEALQSQPNPDAQAITQLRREIEERQQKSQLAVQASQTKAISPPISALRDVFGSDSKSFYIQGAVSRPGTYSLLVPTRVLEALVNVGGFRDHADMRNIVIVHATGERDQFNYNEVITGTNPGQNIFLKSGDIIIVK